MNLVNMAMKYIGPAIAERVASKLGIGGPVVNKLIAAALPAILGSLIGKSKSSTGLGSIMDLVSGAERPNTNGLASAFDDGSDIDELARSGGGMLEGLLGAGGMATLAGALGNHAGVDQAKAGSLLGMLAPTALGSIGDQVAEQGLDSAGLASFLDGQAGNVAQAMPAEFASQLQGSDLFDGFDLSQASGLGDAAASARAAAETAVENVSDSVQDGAQKSMGMLPWIIGLVVLALLAWFLLGRGDAPDVEAAMGTEMMVGDTDIAGEFSSITGSLTETFQGITDTASAEAALPQLEDLSSQIGSLGDTAGELSGAAQTGFQSIVATALSTLRPIIENAVESSGAGSILQPVVDQILGALEGMAG